MLHSKNCYMDIVWHSSYAYCCCYC